MLVTAEKESDTGCWQLVTCKRCAWVIEPLMAVAVTDAKPGQRETFSGVGVTDLAGSFFGIPPF